ncbi:MAG: hypothetical protein Q9186_006144 [Xanthomendoza sp. 1 TL-2023]
MALTDLAPAVSSLARLAISEASGGVQSLFLNSLQVGAPLVPSRPIVSASHEHFNGEFDSALRSTGP